MSPLLDCGIDHQISTTTDPYLLELEEVVLDSTRWFEIEGLLRALSRPIMDAAVTMKFEAVEPYELGLEFAAGQITGRIEGPVDEVIIGVSGSSGHVASYPSYILGRIDSLLDICDMAIDRSVSQTTLEVGRQRHVKSILEHLRQEGETRAGDLAEAIGIERNHLSNILKRLEEAGLVRRATVGRSTLVSLGPKAAVVLTTLHAQPYQDMEVETFDLGEQKTEQSEAITAIATPTATAA